MRKKPSNRLLLILAALPVFALSAQDARACALTAAELTTSAHSTNLEYDPRSPEDFRVFLKAEFDGEIDPGLCAQESITIELETAGVHALARDGGGGALSMRFLNQGKITSGRPFMEILRNQFSLAGDYRQRFRVYLDADPLNALNLELQATATPITHFVHGAFSTSIDFGQIGDGEIQPRLDSSILEKTVDFIYQANMPVKVTLESLGGGHLRLEGRPDLTPIPYTVKINDAPVRIGPEHEKALDLGLGQNKSGTISVLLGDVVGLSAGSYSDQLTVVFTPNY